MPKITFIDSEGTSKTVDAEAGDVLMRAAVDHEVEGIIAECGGSMMCATCHVYVEESQQHLTGPRNDGELEMLEWSEAECKPNSRLSCQITITPELEGLVVRVPAEM